MLSGQEGWIAGTYLADKDLCDVRITGGGPGVSISYPTNTATYTSFYREAWLPDGGLDFSALKVTVSPTVTSAVPVTLSASYVKTATGKAGIAGACHGTRKTQTITATLPFTLSATPYTVRTTEVSVARSAPAWVQVVVRGNLPGTGALRATLAPPAGMDVTYAGDGTSAGLHDGAVPAVGYDDYFAFRIDAAALAAGTCRVPLTVTSGATTTTTRLVVVVTGAAKTTAAAAAARLTGKAATTAYTKLAAARLCTVSHTVYPTPAALQAAYRKVEKASGLTSAQIATFDRQAATNPGLRKAIARQYAATCS